MYSLVLSRPTGYSIKQPITTSSELSDPYTNVYFPVYIFVQIFFIIYNILFFVGFPLLCRPHGLWEIARII